MKGLERPTRFARRAMALCMAVIVLLNVACAGQPACDPPNDARNVPYRAFVGLMSQTYRMEGTQTSTQTFYASGTIIYRSVSMPDIGFAITADHFCDHRNDDILTRLHQEFSVHDTLGRRHEALFHFRVNMGPEVDACVLSFIGMDDLVEVSDVADRDPKPGDRVYNLAAPGKLYGPNFVLTFEGLYSGYSDDGLISVYTIPTTYGSSGSGIFNPWGELIGMIWGFPSTEDGGKILEDIAYSNPPSVIRNVKRSLESSDPIVGDIIRISRLMSLPNLSQLSTSTTSTVSP